LHTLGHPAEMQNHEPDQANGCKRNRNQPSNSDPGRPRSIARIESEITECPHVQRQQYHPEDERNDEATNREYSPPSTTLLRFSVLFIFTCASCKSFELLLTNKPSYASGLLLSSVLITLSGTTVSMKSRIMQNSGYQLCYSAIALDWFMIHVVRGALTP
jgi:hypothetical protein